MLLVTVLVASCGSGPGVARRVTTESDGTERVDLTRVPSVNDADYEWSLTLRSSFSTEAADGTPLLFDPRSIARLPDGTLVVADLGETALAIVRPGEDLVVRAFAQVGRGPGEIYGGYPVLWPESGSSFWVADRGNARISLFDTTGALLREAPIPEGAGVTLSLTPYAPTDRLYAQHLSQRADAGVGTHAVAALDFNSGEVTSVVELQQDSDPPNVMVLWNHRALWTVLGDGHIITGHDDSLRFAIWSLSGDMVREVQLDAPPREVTEADRRRVLSEVGRPAGSVEVSDHFPFSDIYYAFSDSVFALRHTWVSHAENDAVPEGSFSWRLVSSGGYYMGAINFPPDFEPKWCDGETLVGLQRDSRGVAEIHEYALGMPLALKAR